MNQTFDNSTIKTGLSSGYILIHGLLTYCALFSNVVCFAFIKWKLEINPYVKTILTLDVQSKLFLLTIAAAGHFRAFIMGHRDLYSCSLAILPNAIATVGSYVFPAAMSVIRYHMATSMEKHQRFKIWFIYSVTGIAIGSLALISSVMLIIVFGYNASFGPVLQSCHEAKNPSTSPTVIIGPVLCLLTGASGLAIGIIFDIGMYKFLKRRQTVICPAIAMVAWGPPIVSGGSKDKMKATVPIKATTLGVINLCIIFIINYFIVFHFSNADYGRYAFRTCLGLYAMAHMPLILFLTVKSNKSKGASNVHPPHGLQFHEG